MKYLPGAPKEGQFRVQAQSSSRNSPFENEEGTIEVKVAAKGEQPIQIKMQRAKLEEYITPGIQTYDELKALTGKDLEDEPWTPAREGYSEVSELPSPTYEEMAGLEDKYWRKLENVETEAEEKEVLKEIWEEAAEMELEGQKPIGV